MAEEPDFFAPHPNPKPRVKNSMFCVVPDAFESKSIALTGEQRRKKELADQSPSKSADDAPVAVEETIAQQDYVVVEAQPWETSKHEVTIYLYIISFFQFQYDIPVYDLILSLSTQYTRIWLVSFSFNTIYLYIIGFFQFQYDIPVYDLFLSVSTPYTRIWLVSFSFNMIYLYMICFFQFQHHIPVYY